MGSKKLSWVYGAMLLLQLIPAILGWGQYGHYATCKIAEAFLSKNAMAAVKKLLPKSASGKLAEFCSWPDQMLFRYRWSGPLHYIDTPDFKCQYNYNRDCHDSTGTKGRCVTGAIYNYTQQLVSGYSKQPSSKANYNLTEALIFLSHFVGDVHQPLHVGFTTDRGGNTIRVKWFRQQSNLHHVWDTNIIETALKRFYGSNLAKFIQDIQKNISGSLADDDLVSREVYALKRTASPELYASESVALACKYAYKNATQGTTLEDGYFLSRLPVVKKQLGQGGVRLAAVLNSIFASRPRISSLRGFLGFP
ncbi:hypothetical protein Dimus_035179 [Dionaea muscipula]